MQTGEDQTDGELRADLERYCEMAAAMRSAWADFWFVAICLLSGGGAVFYFSGDPWAILVLSLLVVWLLTRTAERTGRLGGELSYLHRKWLRRGQVFATDGRSAEAIQREAE